MLVKWLAIALIGAVSLLTLAAPWMVACAWWKERNDPYGLNPIGGIVAMLICLFEILMLVDWAMGKSILI